MSTLYAIPATLGGEPATVLAPSALEIIRGLRAFAVENAKSARAFLKAVGMPCPLQDLRIVEIGTDTSPFLAVLGGGRDLGLLSEAGCPAIADPGATVVSAAHAGGHRVVPLVGPSSLVLALMASGLEGQRFAFCGYLPREAAERQARIRALEQRSRKEDETELFIETPYRNDVMVAALLDTCAPSTRLCLASDLTLPEQAVATKSIAEWRRRPPVIGKRPTVFLLLAR